MVNCCSGSPNNESEVKEELSDKTINHHLPDSISELRFELFDWLKEKGLTVRQAINLLNMTKRDS